MQSTPPPVLPAGNRWPQTAWKVASARRIRTPFGGMQVRRRHHGWYLAGDRLQVFLVSNSGWALSTCRVLLRRCGCPRAGVCGWSGASVGWLGPSLCLCFARACLSNRTSPLVTPPVWAPGAAVRFPATLMGRVVVSPVPVLHSLESAPVCIGPRPF